MCCLRTVPPLARCRVHDWLRATLCAAARRCVPLVETVLCTVPLLARPPPSYGCKQRCAQQRTQRAAMCRATSPLTRRQLQRDTASEAEWAMANEVPREEATKHAAATEPV